MGAALVGAVTEAMAEAGAEVVLQWAESDDYSRTDLATRVFLAMESTRLLVQGSSSEDGSAPCQSSWISMDRWNSCSAVTVEFGRVPSVDVKMVVSSELNQIPWVASFLF
jgi:hypothetical protein